MIALALLGCTPTSPPAPPTRSPDADSTRAAIDAVCKLFEGADRDCTRGKNKVSVDGHEYGVRAEIYPVQSGLGMASLRGVVILDDSENTYITRLRGFGGTKAEAVERSMHEWALVSGLAVVDTWLAPADRPALRAIEPDLPAIDLKLGGRAVLRGWPYFQPKGVIYHDKLLTALDPAFPQDPPPGVISLEVVRQRGETAVECWFQGEPHEALCEAARSWTWPSAEYELRLAYVVQPPTP